MDSEVRAGKDHGKKFRSRLAASLSGISIVCNVLRKSFRQEVATVSIDPFTKRHKLVHNGGFPKFEVLYCSQNTVKPIRIQ